MVQHWRNADPFPHGRSLLSPSQAPGKVRILFSFDISRGKRYDFAALLPLDRYNEVTECESIRQIVVLMCRGSQSVQSFQQTNKLRSIVFYAVVLAFFAAISAYAPAQTKKLATTTTTLSLVSQDAEAHNHATFAVSVSSPDQTPTGTVTLYSGSTQIGSAALDSTGNAKIALDAMPAGDAKIQAVYNGDTLHAVSNSVVRPMDTTTGVPDYSITANPTSVTVTAGSYGTMQVTITPINGFSQNVSLSCSGVPSSTTCAFSPVTVATASGAVTSTLNIQTTGVSGAQLRTSSQLYYAIAAPGMLMLIGLAGFRKRSVVVNRILCLVVLAGMTFGLSACAARYNYFHHGPADNTGTTAGTYSLNIIAISDNGVTATNKTLPITLIVK